MNWMRHLTRLIELLIARFGIILGIPINRFLRFNGFLLILLCQYCDCYYACKSAFSLLSVQSISLFKSSFSASAFSVDTVWHRKLHCLSVMYGFFPT